MPKGAYVPFGLGSRQCLGMRFGRLEIKAIAARILARSTGSSSRPGTASTVRQTPTLGPRDGLPMRIRAAARRRMTSTSLVLAAGEGRRFGGPKQLAPLRGRPLLAHAVATARAGRHGPRRRRARRPRRRGARGRSTSPRVEVVGLRGLG